MLVVESRQVVFMPDRQSAPYMAVNLTPKGPNYAASVSHWHFPWYERQSKSNAKWPNSDKHTTTLQKQCLALHNVSPGHQVRRHYAIEISTTAMARVLGDCSEDKLCKRPSIFPLEGQKSKCMLQHLISRLVDEHRLSHGFRYKSGHGLAW